jgi:hypothetical protein
LSGKTSDNADSQTSNSGPDVSSQSNLEEGEKMSDRSGGYNESPEQAKVGGG